MYTAAQEHKYNRTRTGHVFRQPNTDMELTNLASSLLSLSLLERVDRLHCLFPLWLDKKLPMFLVCLAGLLLAVSGLLFMAFSSAPRVVFLWLACESGSPSHLIVICYIIDSVIALFQAAMSPKIEQTTCSKFFRSLTLLPYQGCLQLRISQVSCHRETIHTHNKVDDHFSQSPINSIFMSLRNIKSWFVEQVSIMWLH